MQFVREARGDLVHGTLMTTLVHGRDTWGDVPTDVDVTVSGSVLCDTCVHTRVVFKLSTTARIAVGGGMAVSRVSLCPDVLCLYL